MPEVVDVGLHVRSLATLDELHGAADLLAGVWKVGESYQPIEPALVKALAHSGNYVAGAYAGPELIGAAIGFLAQAGHLHSHVTGVLPRYRGLDAGFALKRHQRRWALGCGIREIHWTYDPLIGRNAYFNLVKLGAHVTDYLPDFYGVMRDGINGDDASDRLYLVWPLDSPRVVAAVAGEPFQGAAGRPGDAVPLVEREGDEPVVLDYAPARALLVAVPRDVEEVRAADPDLAARWRLVVRRALQAALADGYQITGITRDGYYVLEGSR